jgi:hypothetical protein
VTIALIASGPVTALSTAHAVLNARAIAMLDFSSGSTASVGEAESWCPWLEHMTSF